MVIVSILSYSDTKYRTMSASIVESKSAAAKGQPPATGGIEMIGQY